MKDDAGRGRLRRQGGQPPQPGALLLQARSGDTRAFIPFLETCSRDVETVVVTHREGGAAPRERADQEVPACASTSSCGTTRTSSACGSTASARIPRLEVVRRIQQRRGALLRAVRQRELDPGDAADHQPLLPAAHLHRSRAAQPPAALPAVPDRPLPGAVRATRLAGGVPPSPCEEVALFLEGKGGELIEALRARMKARRGGAASSSRRRGCAISSSPSSAAWSGRRSRPPRPIDQDVFGFHREADRLLDLRALRPPGAAQRRPAASPSPGRSSPTRSCSRRSSTCTTTRSNVRPQGGAPAAASREGELERARGAATEKQRASGSGCSCPSAGEKLRPGGDGAAERRAGAPRPAAEPGRDGGGAGAAAGRLHLAGCPRRMECFDISHFQGATIVAIAGGGDRRRAGQGALPAVPDQERAGAGRLRLDVRGGSRRLRRGTGGDGPAGSPGHRRRQGAARLGAGGDEGRGRRGRRRGGARQEPRARLATIARPSRARSPERVFVPRRRTPSSCRRTRPSCSCSRACATRRTGSPSPTSRS